MTIRDWVKLRGRKNVARALGVDGGTLDNWTRQHPMLPRPWFMKKIHDLSEGRVTYADMVEPIAKNYFDKKNQAG